VLAKWYLPVDNAILDLDLTELLEQVQILLDKLIDTLRIVSLEELVVQDIDEYSTLLVELIER
jgi:hypothetical protein